RRAFDRSSKRLPHRRDDRPDSTWLPRGPRQPNKAPVFSFPTDTVEFQRPPLHIKATLSKERLHYPSARSSWLSAVSPGASTDRAPKGLSNPAPQTPDPPEYIRFVRASSWRPGHTPCSARALFDVP